MRTADGETKDSSSTWMRISVVFVIPLLSVKGINIY